MCPVNRRGWLFFAFSALVNVLGDLANSVALCGVAHRLVGVSVGR